MLPPARSLSSQSFFFLQQAPRSSLKSPSMPISPEPQLPRAPNRVSRLIIFLLVNVFRTVTVVVFLAASESIQQVRNRIDKTIKYLVFHIVYNTADTIRPVSTSVPIIGMIPSYKLPIAKIYPLYRMCHCSVNPFGNLFKYTLGYFKYILHTFLSIFDWLIWR